MAHSGFRPAQPPKNKKRPSPPFFGGLGRFAIFVFWREKQPTTSAAADRSSALALAHWLWLWLCIHNRRFPAMLAEKGEVYQPCCPE